MSSSETHEAVRREIQSEKASALANAVRVLEAALDALDRASPRDRREALVDARERLWFVVVQREAMGLHRHEGLYETLRVPREVRFAMGPRRR